ncbi:MAG: superoxide dismutase [Acidobacteria bacterium]|nr:superoxide dismutase [Acidobacteriota bacterium]MCB9398012.1 superoxide dismutase [Acidobacteriota bacterium]
MLNTDRRTVLKTLAAAAATPLFTAATRPAAFVSLAEPKLPYAENALDPVISANTMGFHFGKHHMGYFKKLTAKIQGTAMESQDLNAIISAAHGNDQGLFNLAAQTWNHSFYWQSMKPNGGGMPPAALKAALEKSFGSLDAFKEQFSKTASSHFGSGWAWLVADGDSLKVLSTSDAGTPLTDGLKPLLTIDVWEHAYYLDYQNRRADYVAAIIDKCLNWEFAAQNLAG